MEVFERQVLDTCGFFDEALQFAEDVDLITRCWKWGVRKLNLDRVSLLDRRRDGSMIKGKPSAPEHTTEASQVGYAQHIGRAVLPHAEGLREPVEGLEP